MRSRGLALLMVSWVLAVAGACSSSSSGSAKSGGSAAGSSGSGHNSSAEGGNAGAGGNTGARDAGAADAGSPLIRDGGFGAPDAAPAGGSTSSSGGAGGRTGTGGTSAAGGAGGGAGGGTGKTDAGVLGPCRVDISADEPQSLDNLVPGDLRTVIVKGHIVWGTTKETQPNWRWVVTGPDHTALNTVDVYTAETRTTKIQFPLLSPGTYDISVSVTDTCRGQVKAYASKEQSQEYFMRVLPPPGGMPNANQACGNTNRWCPSEDAVPYEANNLVLQDGPQTVHVSLLKGFAVKIDPTLGGSTIPTGLPSVGVPSAIRVAPRDSTWTIDGASTNRGGFTAMLYPGKERLYDVLVSPNPSTEADKITLPPFRIGSLSYDKVSRADYGATPGVTVQGAVRGPAGPLMGARVLLRADAAEGVNLPLASTWGNTDALGAYRLQARDGYSAFSVVVIAPVGTTLPQVTIPNCLDLRNTPNGATVSNVDFAWRALPSTNLTLTVTMAEGQSPAAGVQVRLQSIDDEAMLAPGTLTINGAEQSSASGHLRLEATTDQAGVAPFGALPKARYHLVFSPPDSLSEAALTAADLDLTSAGNDERRAFPLSRKVKLSGRILPPEASSGGRMVAIDTGTDTLGNSTSSIIDEKGNYTLEAAPGRAYRFLVEPAPGKNLPTRIPLYGVTTTNQDTRLADRTLPTGLRVSGTVSFISKGVAGALVQVYCRQAGMSGCMDPGNPAATLPQPMVEIATQPDGSYVLYLPDPTSGN